jgi:hypothetical protein
MFAPSFLVKSVVGFQLSTASIPGSNVAPSQTTQTFQLSMAICGKFHVTTRGIKSQWKKRAHTTDETPQQDLLQREGTAKFLVNETAKNILLPPPWPAKVTNGGHKRHRHSTIIPSRVRTDRRSRKYMHNQRQLNDLRYWTNLPSSVFWVPVNVVCSPPFFPLLFSIEPFLTRLVPPLPSVIDPDLLATIWDIFGEKSINGRIYEKKTEEWSTLEWLGDGVLAWKARSILSKIFGEDNYRLSKALVDHAKGNGFLLEVGKAYHLDKWTKESPSDEKDKLWADMVEVWLGAAEVERQLWGESDYCSETEIFLDQLWTIRYGKLLDNWISSDIEPVSKDEVAVQFDIFDIDIPKSKEIMRLCSFSTTMNNRNVGYLVEASVKPTKQSKSTDTLVARSLCSSSETAQRQAADKLYQLLRRMSLFINLIIERQQPDRHSSGEPDLSSPPSQSPTLFQKYRLRIFQHIREQMTKNDSTVSPNSIIMKVEDKYCQWIIELQKTLPSKDQLKTITMLRWYQVPFPIFDADFSYTFIRERTTLRCLTFALKRC